MNMLLKCLAAVALVCVIIAAGVFVIGQYATKQQPPTPKPPEPATTTAAPTTPVVVTTGPAVPLTSTPIVIKPDNPLQPTYRPLNQPTYLQFLRQKGKTYHSQVLGKLTGQASKKDWGVRGVAYFEYLYGVESTGKIIENDGVTVIEERVFGKVNETLVTSGYEIRIEVPERLQTMLDWISPVSAEAAAVSSALGTINNVQVPVKKEWVELARKAGLFTKLPAIDPQKFESEIKLFTQGTENRLLEGKTVRIVFKDGAGVSQITPIGCGLSDRERDIIVRTNFVLDHYLFPDHKVEPGADWTIDGSVLAGFLDPRLNGKVGGKVTVIRAPDHPGDDGKIAWRLKITDGQVVIQDTNGAASITGQLTQLKGTCGIPSELGIITSAHLTGFADYRKLSRDHLLFDAQTTVQPKIEIRYECEVK